MSTVLRTRYPVCVNSYKFLCDLSEASAKDPPKRTKKVENCHKLARLHLSTLIDQPCFYHLNAILDKPLPSHCGHCLHLSGSQQFPVLDRADEASLHQPSRTSSSCGVCHTVAQKKQRNLHDGEVLLTLAIGCNQPSDASWNLIHMLVAIRSML